MSAIAPVPLAPPAGVVVTESSRVVEGRWIAPFDKVRFVKGRPQKIGGNIRVTATPMSGQPRCIHAWRDFSQNPYVAAGTYRKLYAFDSTYTLNDITPIERSGTLGNNPFTTTNGFSTVGVNHTTHGRQPGDTVIFASAAPFNNVTMNGAFVVQTISDPNNYSVIATTTANANGTGGGAAVTFQYEIGIGAELGAFGQGWGVGPWGLDPWGTPRSGSVKTGEPRVWQIDHFGVVALATYNGGTLWSFDPTTQSWPANASRALGTFGGNPMNPVAGGTAPSDFRSMFISPERFVFGLCDKMVVKVASQNDPTTWTPAITNTAFQRTLQEGTKLIGGKPLAPFISLVWTDAALYLFQYTGSNFVYNSSLVGRDCGLLSPNAAVTVDGIAYWMGADNFYVFNGSVASIPNVEDIRKFVFDAVPPSLAFQCHAVYVPKYHEVWFFYPTTGDTKPSRYVIYHINDQCWSIGEGLFYSSVGITAGRASGTHHTQGDTSPLMASTDGFIHNHDPPGDTFNDNGTALTWTLTLSPMTKSEGLQNLDIEGILWDFFQQQGTITATVNTFDRLTDNAPMDSETETVAAVDSGLTDYRVGGRYLGFTLGSSDLGSYFRYGKPVAFVRPSARRR